MCNCLDTPNWDKQKFLTLTIYIFYHRILIITGLLHTKSIQLDHDYTHSFKIKKYNITLDKKTSVAGTMNLYTEYYPEKKVIDGTKGTLKSQTCLKHL